MQLVHILTKLINELGHMGVAFVVFVVAMLTLSINAHVQQIRRERKEQHLAKLAGMKFMDENGERISKYATIWGIDNSVDNMDPHRLIEATEKLGFDKLELMELHERIQEGNRREHELSFAELKSMSVVRKILKATVKVSFALFRHLFLDVFVVIGDVLKTTNKLHGGIEDENNHA